MQALDAFEIFHAAHRKSALFIHTSASDPRRGFPIAEYATHLNLGHAVFGLPAYTAALKLDRRHMAWLYSAFDCLLAASAREGFGLPIIVSTPRSLSSPSLAAAPLHRSRWVDRPARLRKPGGGVSVSHVA